MKTILPLLLLVAPLTNAMDINVADHGIVPGQDVTFAVNKLLEAHRGEVNLTLSFPKGVYEFRPENGREEFRAVSNHDNSLKRMAFPLHGYKNITIDGGGATFLFHGRISPIVVESVRGATLKNFTIDWARSFHDELKVVARDEEAGTATLEADPNHYPYKIRYNQVWFQRDGWEDPFGSNIVFDPETRSPIHNTRDYAVNFTKPHHATPAGKNRFKLQAAFRKSPPPVGSVLVTYGVHPTSRLCPAIHLANSRDIHIENVTIHEAGGMGVIAERTENVRLEKVTVSSNDERLVSTRADATHFIGCKGTIHIENCLFEHMLDDATNVHGAYVKVVEYLGDNEFLCEISHFQQWGLIFAEPGDKVALLSRETVLPFHDTTVTATRKLNERRFVITVDQVPETLPAGPLSMENLTWHPDFVMRNTTIRENRARSILVTTKGKVLIEDNDLSSQMHGILIEGDNNVWYESGGVGDVTIRNNTFVNIGYEGTKRYPLFAAPLFNKTQRYGEGRYHRNIRFVNNTLKSFNGYLVHALSVDGLEIAGNTIEASKDYPRMSEAPSINLRYCANATIRDNRAQGFDQPLEIKASTDSENVVAADNPGFATAK